MSPLQNKIDNLNDYKNTLLDKAKNIVAKNIERKEFIESGRQYIYDNKLKINQGFWSSFYTGRKTTLALIFLSLKRMRIVP